MATINLRSVPDDLHRKAKARAAMEGVTLKQLIMRLLEEYLEGVCYVNRNETGRYAGLSASAPCRAAADVKPELVPDPPLAIRRRAQILAIGIEILVTIMIEIFFCFELKENLLTI